MPRSPRLCIGRTLLAGIALLVVLGGVAYATIPDSNGQVEGCYNPTNAKPPYALSIVHNPAECTAPAVLLPFNKTGPTGPTGPTGGIAPEAGFTSTRTVIVRPVVRL